MEKLLVADRQKGIIYPKVLVVGMSRTGTSSIKKALEILYQAPVYHMSVVLNAPSHLKFWSDLAFGKKDINEASLKAIMQGYVATTDLPSAYYFQSLVEAFPDAKVVLSIRDEEEWAKSYCRLIEAGQRFKLIKFLPPLNRLWPFGEQMHRLIFGKKVVSGKCVDRAAILAGYRAHNKKVLNTVSGENLLTFDVQQGWEPLCNFLEKEVPTTPFPNLNAGTNGPTKIIASAVSRLSTPVIIVFTILTVCLIALSLTR